METVMGRRKHYVTVTSQTNEHGSVTPLTIDWGDGRTYAIDKVTDRRHAKSLSTGAEGLRFTIKVGRTSTYLYYENPCWFVEEKVVDMV